MKGAWKLLMFTVLGAFVIMALLGPWLAPYDPYALGEQAAEAPSAAHWCGTDQLGRDVLSRLIYGARTSMGVAVGAVAAALFAGTMMGLVAGWRGGWIDAVLSRAMDVMFALPAILMALVVLAVLGRGPMNIALAIAIVYTPIFARLARGQTMAIKQQPYVEAARALGLPARRIVMRHVLPNITGPLLVQTTLSLALAILAEAALSYLGLGGSPDAPTWGNMLRTGKDWMQQAWWIAVYPGGAITLLVLSINTLSGGGASIRPRRSSA
ncbi:ABC transporter permease [Planctomycetales bacterium ZRK34]|nr:ABC transporter permease [Planctomycetales bacterium ZRK34]